MLCVFWKKNEEKPSRTHRIAMFQHLSTSDCVTHQNPGRPITEDCATPIRAVGWWEVVSVFYSHWKIIKVLSNWMGRPTNRRSCFDLCKLGLFGSIQLNVCSEGRASLYLFCLEHYQFSSNWKGRLTIETRSLIGVNWDCLDPLMRMFALRVGWVMFEIPEWDLTIETRSLIHLNMSSFGKIIEFSILGVGS